jgi:hypothetical protein
MEGASKPKLNEITKESSRNWILFLLEKMGEVTKKQIEEFKTKHINPAFYKDFEKLDEQEKMGLVVLSTLPKEEFKDVCKYLEDKTYVPGIHAIRNALQILILERIKAEIKKT